MLLPPLMVKEFCAAMALIAGVNEGKQLPSSLPASLIQLVWPAGFPGGAQPPAAAAPAEAYTSSTPGSKLPIYSKLTYN